MTVSIFPKVAPAASWHVDREDDGPDRVDALCDTNALFAERVAKVRDGVADIWALWDGADKAEQKCKERVRETAAELVRLRELDGQNQLRRQHGEPELVQGRGEAPDYFSITYARDTERLARAEQKLQKAEAEYQAAKEKSAALQLRYQCARMTNSRMLLYIRGLPAEITTIPDYNRKPVALSTDQSAEDGIRARAESIANLLAERKAVERDRLTDLVARQRIPSIVDAAEKRLEKTLERGLSRLYSRNSSVKLEEFFPQIEVSKDGGGILRTISDPLAVAVLMDRAKLEAALMARAELCGKAGPLNEEDRAEKLSELDGQILSLRYEIEAILEMHGGERPAESSDPRAILSLPPDWPAPGK